MVSKEKVVQVMSELDRALCEYYPSNSITQYVSESLQTIKNSNGVAFTGQLQYFLNHAPIVKISDNIEFNEKVQALWDKLFSMNELGNNLWGASL
ncbi:hypothetical protein [Lactobacillus hominis]|uniref:Uncharacterized protein n=1 Tax=Lactobacillus hominis DSM 23910 = CRBIP 24.179 TaxID=1423758 RepID=I7IW28_9LACO|nr:hypothetical protein [Lactobacillus hominis]MCT3348268.1 hypothetical protein [Lactobacillus hominis]CCI82468.1 Putative uncharacterized protein [Lactobacillus hominis DSM 23910 = CRBIP 24.179]